MRFPNIFRHFQNNPEFARELESFVKSGASINTLLSGRGRIISSAESRKSILEPLSEAFASRFKGTFSDGYLDVFIPVFETEGRVTKVALTLHFDWHAEYNTIPTIELTLRYFLEDQYGDNYELSVIPKVDGIYSFHCEGEMKNIVTLGRILKDQVNSHLPATFLRKKKIKKTIEELQNDVHAAPYIASEQSSILRSIAQLLYDEVILLLGTHPHVKFDSTMGEVDGLLRAEFDMRDIIL
tara:strand:+ start:5234 stop:5953 length:720 start_codon:yes stop_codon:yes gene_type:complete